MAFGTPRTGWDFGRFDSAAEERCFRALERLVPERVLRAVVPHPHVAGLDVDFLAVLPSNRPCLVEFDGLGPARRSDLGPRLIRLAELADYGIETRWLTSPETEHVRRQMSAYEPPRFVRARSVCGCGAHEERIVIAPAPFTDSVPCGSCG